MKLYEMEGFLRGKCLPGDLLVGESNAEYLVRKLNEAYTMKAERDALAVESIGLRHIAERIVNALYAAGYEPEENSLHPWKSLIFDTEKALETPATDAALAEIKAQGLDELANACDGYAENHVYTFTKRHAEEFAAQLREAK